MPEPSSATASTKIDPDLRFDLIASNIPAKVGKEMLSLYLHDALERCGREDGSIWSPSTGCAST